MAHFWVRLLSLTLIGSAVQPNRTNHGSFDPQHLPSTYLQVQIYTSICERFTRFPSRCGLFKKISLKYSRIQVEIPCPMKLFHTAIFSLSRNLKFPTWGTSREFVLCGGVPEIKGLNLIESRILKIRFYFFRHFRLVQMLLPTATRMALSFHFDLAEIFSTESVLRSAICAGAQAPHEFYSLYNSAKEESSTSLCDHIPCHWSLPLVASANPSSIAFLPFRW